MSCLMGSHGVILAAAMAVSGTVVLLVLCRQRPMSPTVSAVDRRATPSATSLRPCISDSKESEGRKAERKEKKKRVHFAEHVVELYTEDWNAEEATEGGAPVAEEPPSKMMPRVRRGWSECGRRVGAGGGMLANRVALYSGILRDRHQRMACSY